MTVNGCAVDVPPPGPGVTTVMDAAPAVVRSLAGMTAVSCVALTKLVVNAAPLKSATDELTKLVPVSVMVVFGAPTVAEVGLMPVSVGIGLLTVKVCAVDVPPPGLGVTTVMDAVPAVVRSLAGMTAVSCVALTKLVVNAAPLKSATDVLTKLIPVSVMVVFGAPTVAEVGLMPVSVGIGLLMVKVCAVDVPPPGPGVTTVMDAAPAVVRSLAGMTAVSCVALTKLVVNAAPLKSATDELTKLIPVSVMVVFGAPAVAELGLMEVKVARGLEPPGPRRRRCPPCR